MLPCLEKVEWSVVENLDLSAVPAGLYELICLPLNISGAEGCAGAGGAGGRISSPELVEGRDRCSRGDPIAFGCDEGTGAGSACASRNGM